MSGHNKLITSLSLFPVASKFNFLSSKIHLRIALCYRLRNVTWSLLASICMRSFHLANNKHLYISYDSCEFCHRCCLNRILEPTTLAASESANDTAQNRSRTLVRTKTSGRYVNSPTAVIICFIIHKLQSAVCTPCLKKQVTFI